MNTIKNFLRKYDLCYVYLNIYIALMILIPKNWSTVFGAVPIRLLFSCVLIVVYIIDRYFLKNNYHKMNKSIYVFFCLFLIFTIPSFWMTKSMVVSLYTFMKFAVTIYVFKVFATKELNSKQYLIFFKTLLVCFASVVLYGIIQYIFGINLQTVGIINYPPAKGRVVSNFFNTIYFGLFINLFIPYIIYFIFFSTKKKHKLFFSMLLILSFSALLLTFSRSSFLVFGGLVFLMLVLNYKFIFNKVAFPSLCACLILLFAIPGANKLLIASLEDAFSLFTQVDVLQQFLPSFGDSSNSLVDNPSPQQPENVEPKPDMENNGESSGVNSDGEEPSSGDDSEVLFGDLSLSHRKDFAVIANTIANDHMFTGVGFGTYIDYMRSDDFAQKYAYYVGSKTHPHSAFVLTFAEVGILAVISLGLFYLSIGILSFKELIGYFKSKNNLLSIPLFVAIVGFLMVNIISENAIYDSQVYVIFLMIIGLSFNYIKYCKEAKKAI